MCRYGCLVEWFSLCEDRQSNLNRVSPEKAELYSIPSSIVHTSQTSLCDLLVALPISDPANCTYNIPTNFLFSTQTSLSLQNSPDNEMAYVGNIQSNKPYECSPPQATPSVSFTDDVEIRCVENLTCKYREDLWFVACEMKTFKYSTVLVLQKLGSMNISMVQYAEMEYRGHKVR